MEKNVGEGGSKSAQNAQLSFKNIKKEAKDCSFNPLNLWGKKDGKAHMWCGEEGTQTEVQ